MTGCCLIKRHYMLHDNNNYNQYNHLKIKFAGLCNTISKILKFLSVKSKRRGENAQKVQNN